MTAQTASGRLKDRVALITGAGRGIGRAIALKFAQEGAGLVLNARHRETLEQTRALAKDTGGRIEVYPADVSDRAAVEGMVEQTVKWFGRIDALVNNAGIYQPAPFMDYTDEDLDRILKVNLFGPFHTSQCALAHMLPAGRGKIVNIASTAGKWASNNQSIYNMSKHALVGMTRCLALEMAPRGIQVNAICPYVVETDLVLDMAKGLGLQMDQLRAAIVQRVPMGRLVTPEEVAHLAVYLASSESDGMTGQSILLDGGVLFV